MIAVFVIIKTTNLLQQFMVLVITNEQCFKNTYNVHNYNNIYQIHYILFNKIICKRCVDVMWMMIIKILNVTLTIETVVLPFHLM